MNERQPDYAFAAALAKQAAERKVRELTDEIGALGEQIKMLARVQLGHWKPRIEFVPSMGWEVFIPPYSLDHFEGDAIVGPYHVTYHQTLEEAVDFFKQVTLDDLNVIPATPESFKKEQS